MADHVFDPQSIGRNAAKAQPLQNLERALRQKLCPLVRNPTGRINDGGGYTPFSQSDGRCETRRPTTCDQNSEHLDFAASKTLVGRLIQGRGSFCRRAFCRERQRFFFQFEVDYVFGQIQSGIALSKIW